MHSKRRIANDGGAADKDEPLKADVRWLGRLLGDTVQAQQGSEVFDLVETIRRTSVQFYRDDDLAARTALEEILGSLDPARMVLVIRALRVDAPVRLDKSRCPPRSLLASCTGMTWACSSQPP